MEWYHCLTIIGSMFAMMLWCSRERRTDYLHFEKKLEDYRKETLTLIQSIQEEMKDFHARLCVIEERKKK